MAGPTRSSTAWRGSFDWGGSLATAVAGGEYGEQWALTTEDTLSLWLTAAHAAGRSVFDYELAGYAAIDSEGEPVFDLTGLNLGIELPGFPLASALSQVTVGRFELRDPSGYVIEHLVDPSARSLTRVLAPSERVLGGRPDPASGEGAAGNGEHGTERERS